MKKLVLAGVFAAMIGATALTGTAQAGIVRDNAGCGVGQMIFGEKDGVLFQILATTTNGIFGNQTFGMTSGTLGCKKAGFASNDKLDHFVSANMDLLAMDMAAGKGESLSTLAELMNIEKGNQGAFFASLQQNFSKIYTTENVQSADVINNIVKVINA